MLIWYRCPRRAAVAHKLKLSSHTALKLQTDTSPGEETAARSAQAITTLSKGPNLLIGEHIPDAVAGQQEELVPRLQLLRAHLGRRRHDLCLWAQPLVLQQAGLRA